VSLSIVVESRNTDGRIDRVLAQLAPQVGVAQVVVTHAGLTAAQRRSAETRLRRPIHWVELARDAGYYDHKNRGFDASTGDIVAFLDGDTDPSPGWLAALTAPFADGAQVVAGKTSYPGALAALGTELDFPLFAAETPGCVRAFFANNVAFRREVFAARRYPELPMFHGQCQVLALQLRAAGIAIRFAPDARVTHAWPDDLADWLEVRLLRGADTRSLLPHLIEAYAPVALPAVRRLGALPALALLGVRAATGVAHAVRRGPRLRGLGLVAAVTVADALGAAAAPAVYRWIA